MPNINATVRISVKKSQHSTLITTIEVCWKMFVNQRHWFILKENMVLVVAITSWLYNNMVFKHLPKQFNSFNNFMWSNLDYNFSTIIIIISYYRIKYSIFFLIFNTYVIIIVFCMDKIKRLFFQNIFISYLFFFFLFFKALFFQYHKNKFIYSYDDEK